MGNILFKDEYEHLIYDLILTFNRPIGILVGVGKMGLMC